MDKNILNRDLQILEGYWLPTRFNYDEKDQLSSLILTNQISRENASKYCKTNL